MGRNSLRVFRKRRNVGKTREASHSSAGDTFEVSSVSSSQKKLSKIGERYEPFRDTCEESDCNEIFHISVLQDIFLNSVCCKLCKQSGLTLQVKRRIGLATHFVLRCTNCNFERDFFNTEKCNESVGDLFSINVCLVYGLRAIGRGSAAGSVLCGVMNLPPPPTKFGKYNVIIGDAVEDVAFQSMKNATKEAIEENNGCSDISAAFDGTWQKRGHLSLNGVVTATSVDTGKVLDVAVMSKHCRCQNKLKGEHSSKCEANYHGASGGMEVAGVKEIFQRSSNVRYVNYLGDGDSKAYKAIQELEPYGKEVQITKLECLGHVQKRMGTRLRRLKAANKGKKLEDNKGLHGKNRLTNSAIDKIQNYYGLAIRQNINDVRKMNTAVWAVLFHIASTDEAPCHGLCPDGSDSWCKYKKAQITGKEYKHKNSLPYAVVQEIKPIFRDLSKTELLNKCLHGRTQNPNESFNNVIWSRVPKNVFVCNNTLHLGVYDAVATFNDGNISRCEVLKKLNARVGYHTVTTMYNQDKERLRTSVKAFSDIESKARGKRRNAKRKLEDEFENNEDDPAYGPGMH